MILLSIVAARAMPFVVTDPTDIPAVQTAMDDFWPDSDLVVTEGPSPDIPRFELTYDALFWITAEGVHQREVTSPDTAVLLARSWVLAGPPTTELGWVPSSVIGVEPPTTIPASEDHERKPIFDDVWFGLGLRYGRPKLEGLSGAGTIAGVRRGTWVLQLLSSSRVVPALGRIERTAIAAGVYSPESDVLYDTRYGLALHGGLSARKALGRDTQIEGLVLVGLELQQFTAVRVRDAAGEADILFEGPKWDVGPSLGLGGELRLQHVGFRPIGFIDFRDREGLRVMGYFTGSVVFHP